DDVHRRGRHVLRKRPARARRARAPAEQRKGRRTVKDLFYVEGKIALVTGGSRGIGLMITHRYVAGGVKVNVASRKKAACDETAAELNKLGKGSCVSLPGDISTEEGVKALASELAAKEPKLDILVNNAGTNWGAPLADYNDDAFQKVLATNV